MAVDIEGFDIVFSAANANHARTIDQSIANMEKNMGSLKQSSAAFADTMERLASLFKDFNAYTKHEMEINKEINRRQRERQNNDFKPSLSFRDSNVNDSLEFC